MAQLTEDQLRWSQTTEELGNVIKSLDAEFSDTVDLLDENPKAIWIKSSGTLKVDTVGGTTIEIEGINNDTKIDWIRIKRIYSSTSGSAVSGVFGIY